MTRLNCNNIFLLTDSKLVYLAHHLDDGAVHGWRLAYNGTYQEVNAHPDMTASWESAYARNGMVEVKGHKGQEYLLFPTGNNLKLQDAPVRREAKGKVTQVQGWYIACIDTAHGKKWAAAAFKENLKDAYETASFKSKASLLAWIKENPLTDELAAQEQQTALVIPKGMGYPL